MVYVDRVELYKKIEKDRDRPHITYITSSRHNASAQMAQDIIPELTKQLNEIPKDETKIDILVVSR